MASLGSNWARLKAQLPPAAPRKRPAAEPSTPLEAPKAPKRARKAARPTKASLEQSIRLELGRWAIMDRVAEAYEANVEPVLGGAESGRGAQKRKRHLEAWLWARRFHPLLPLGEPAKEAMVAGSATLARKLQNAGLRPKESRLRVCRLAKILRSPVAPAEGDVRVAEEERDGRVALTCGGRAVEVLPAYLAKLRKRCSPGVDFREAAFLMLARYRVLQVHDKGGGNQGAVPEAVFQTLERWAAKPVVEAFASPLNALAAAGNYHSAFADVDAPFGSRGSFFGATFDEGVVEVNPPFDEDIVQRVADVCEASLARAAAARRLLVFLVVVPETDWPGHAALLASKFARWTRMLPAGQHFYQVGNQHVNSTRAYPASRNTTLLLLASQPVSGQGKLGDQIERAFRAQPV